MFPMKVSTNFQQLQSDIFTFPLNDYSGYSFPSSRNRNNLPWADEFLQLSLVETPDYMMCLMSLNIFPPGSPCSTSSFKCPGPIFASVGIQSQQEVSER